MGTSRDATEETNAPLRMLQAAAAVALIVVLVVTFFVARRHGVLVASFGAAYVGSAVVVGAVALVAQAARPRPRRTVVPRPAEEEMRVAA